MIGPDWLAASSGLPAHRQARAGDLLLWEVRGPYRYRVPDPSVAALQVGLDNLGSGCSPLSQVPTVVGQTLTDVEVVVGVYTRRTLLPELSGCAVPTAASTVTWITLTLDAPLGDRVVLDGTTHDPVVPDAPSTIPSP